MANIYKGVAIHWGSGTTACTLFGGKVITRDHERKAEKEQVKDENGNTVSVVYFDNNEQATFECVVTGSGTNSGTATITLPDIGSVATLTDSVNSQITGSGSGANCWLVDEAGSKSSNNGAAKITIRLMRWANLTV